VAQKVSQFVRSRQEILHGLAKHLKFKVPPAFDKFLATAEKGNWEEIQQSWKSLKKAREDNDWSEGASMLWPVITETYGVAETAHTWPAQKLLDFGQAVLGSLRPNMVYVGGNDAGRYIPTLLNETSDGERHIVLSQNAFADASYLAYVRFLYSDRLATLTSDDSQRGFQNYLADAQKRVQHDQQFPNDPRQIRPGEDVRITDNRVQVSGQVAVTAINEKLFQTLMEKNPNMSFAINQSWVAFQSTYASAVPLGPIMELRNQDGLTPERAAQAVDYWRTTTQQLLSDPAITGSSPVRLAFGEMASNQAALLLDRKYVAEAEQTFRMAAELLPANPAVVFRYVSFLTGQKRFDDAIPVVQNAAHLAPDNQQFRDLLAQLQRNKN